MNAAQFKIFDSFRKELRSYCQDFNLRFGAELAPLQAAAAKKDTPDYPVETPVVYNTALDELTEDSVITKIVIGDNPGKNEQLAVNQKYLVGLAGKVAAGFFERNPEFGTDFRKNVIILNKTPVHSAKTNHLKAILKNASEELRQAINDSTLWMAQKTAKLHQDLCAAASVNVTLTANPAAASVDVALTADSADFVPELWLVGYAELKGKGIFLNYRDALKKAYFPDGRKDPAWDKVKVFQHFSMSRFTIDLDSFKEKNGLQDNLKAVNQLGIIHRDEIFNQAEL